MKWVKRGRIWEPGGAWWKRQYGMMPTPLVLPEENRIRVYFGATDENVFGRISYVDLAADDPSRILREHDGFVLDVGEDGAFDDCGVVPSCAVRDEDRIMLYTVGFQRCVKTPFMLFAGLAESSDGENFRRVSDAPILPREPGRAFGQGAPCVIREEGRWRMWHWFADGWSREGGKAYYKYHIGRAESDDGRTWRMYGDACLSPEEGECGVARPWVVKAGGIWHMFFSRRMADAGSGKVSYGGIGRAVSEDGIRWRRVENDVLLPSPGDGWDSEMTCYAAVFEAGGRWIMLYNGNGNGKTGFGWAELEGGWDS